MDIIEREQQETFLESLINICQVEEGGGGTEHMFCNRDVLLKTEWRVTKSDFSSLCLIPVHRGPNVEVLKVLLQMCYYEVTLTNTGSCTREGHKFV
jgi:hypothetical protein